MRWLVLAPLVAATGCNLFWGLDATELIDAGNSELPPASRTKLVWAIATSDGNVTSGIDPMLVYKPIGGESMHPGMVTVLVGGDGPLMPAAYDVGDGTFEIPFDLRESPHRIQYTLPGESVVHEVQWSLTGANITVPRTTRFDAPPPPMGSGYTITPAGFVGQFVSPALYTSGVFTYSNDATKFTQSMTSAALTFKFAQDGVPLTAPSGTPLISNGDWILLTEWAGSGAVSQVSGYAKTQVDLKPNMNVAPSTEPAWTTTPMRTLSTFSCSGAAIDCWPSVNQSMTMTRLGGIPGGSTTTTGHMAYGVSPSTQLPGFLPGVAPTFIDRPLIMPFADITMITSSFSLVDPSDSLALERVATARVSTTRTVTNVMLTNSLQGITNSFATNGLPFAAPLVTQARIGTTSLSGASDSVPFSASSDVQTLTFETEAGYTADDYVVTLYELTTTSLVPVRIYHVIAPSVKIDGSLLVASHQYAFGISTRKGVPGAEVGDYGAAQYPFSQSTTFPRTFVVQ